MERSRRERDERERDEERRRKRRTEEQVDEPRQPGEPAADLAPHTAFDRAVPRPMQIAAAWFWRLLVIAAGVVGFGWVAQYFSEITIPIAIAVLLTAMLHPLARLLRRIGLPHGLAVAISIVGGLVLVVGVLSGITIQIMNGYEELANRAAQGISQLVNWLGSGPLQINEVQINGWIDNLKDFALNSKATIAGYAATIGTSVGHFFAGLALMLFSLIYFLYDGRKIWLFLLNLLPRAARQRTDLAATHGWGALVHYVRATVAVAAVDAIGALIGALILGVPLAPALAALIFLGAFIPLVGAFVSGTIAVAVALVTLGWVKAAIMLAVIVGVMFIEGHFLQPFLLGRAVSLHPLAVLLGIAAGVILGGIVGALIVIPIIAFGKTFIQSLASADGSVPKPSGSKH